VPGWIATAVAAREPDDDLKIQRQNVPLAQAMPDGGRVIAAVTEHTGRPTARSAAMALQRRNRIQEGQSMPQSLQS
jgi:hypothetical protein